MTNRGWALIRCNSSYSLFSLFWFVFCPCLCSGCSHLQPSNTKSAQFWDGQQRSVSLIQDLTKCKICEILFDITSLFCECLNYSVMAIYRFWGYLQLFWLFTTKFYSAPSSNIRAKLEENFTKKSWNFYRLTKKWMPQVKSILRKKQLSTHKFTEQK